MKIILDILEPTDKVKLNLRYPTEKDEEVMKFLRESYEKSQASPGGEHCLQPESHRIGRCYSISSKMSLGLAREVVKNCPDYASIAVSGVYPEGLEKSVYRGPLKLPKISMNLLEENIKLKRTFGVRRKIAACEGYVIIEI